MFLTVSSPSSISSPMFTDIGDKKSVVSKKKPKKTVLSWDQLKAWDGKDIRSAAQPLTSVSILDAFDPVVVAAKRPDPKDFFERYNGRISNKTFKPQYVRINDVTNELLFSQTNVSNFNNVRDCEYPLDYLADAMFIEFKRDLDRSGDGALDVVDMGDGYFTSVDNRRLLIAKKIGVIDRTYAIWVRVHKASDGLSVNLQRRFDGSRTWGEAVQMRINSSDQKFKGYSALPTIMEITRCGRRVCADSQTIPLSIDCDLSELDSADVVNMKKIQENSIIKI